MLIVATYNQLQRMYDHFSYMVQRLPLNIDVKDSYERDWAIKNYATLEAYIQRTRDDKHSKWKHLSLRLDMIPILAEDIKKIKLPKGSKRLLTSIKVIIGKGPIFPVLIAALRVKTLFDRLLTLREYLVAIGAQCLASDEVDKETSFLLRHWYEHNFKEVNRCLFKILSVEGLSLDSESEYGIVFKSVTLSLDCFSHIELSPNILEAFCDARIIFIRKSYM